MPKPIYHLQPVPLSTAAPTLGEPSSKSWDEARRAAWRERKALQAARKNKGELVLRNVILDDDLIEAMGELNRWRGCDRSNPEEMGEALIERAET